MTVMMRCEDAAIDAYLEKFDGASDSYTEASDSCTPEGDSDPCVLDRQLEGQDDNTYTSTAISHSVDDLTLQQSGDTCGDSHVLAPRPYGLPMMSVTHLSSFQTPMITTSHEDISGISDMMEEHGVRDAHHGHMDPQTQEERHDLETMDFIHTYQHEEIESPLLETPLVEQVIETDRLMGHLLPGSACSDEDVPVIDQDDHISCLDTSIWDPGTDNSNRVSAQEDTTAHTGYSMIQRELAVGDEVQSHIGGPNSIVDRDRFSALSFVESVVGDSRVDTSSEGKEVALQHDSDQESRYLEGQLRVSEDAIMVATRRIDDMHALVVDYCWRASMAHDSSDGGFSMDDFHTLRERVSVMRADYQ
jgi:hypothetical protein